jgi:hypothetical protein
VPVVELKSGGHSNAQPAPSTDQILGLPPVYGASSQVSSAGSDAEPTGDGGDMELGGDSPTTVPAEVTAAQANAVAIASLPAYPLSVEARLFPMVNSAGDKDDGYGGSDDGASSGSAPTEDDEDVPYSSDEENEDEADLLARLTAAVRC